MKIYLTGFFIGFILLKSVAQTPDVSYQDLGFTNKIKKVESFSYAMEDKMVTDSSSEIYTFDENGNIISHEYHIYGRYASSTSENSMYKNGLLIKREINVKNRPNFNAIISYEYNKKKNLIRKTYQSAKYKNDFIFSYNKANQLSEIKGVYANNYSIEKLYYVKGKLLKTINQYFDKDIVQSETITFFIDDKKVIEFDPKNKYFTAYLKDKSGNLELKMNYPNLIQNVNQIEWQIKNENLTIAKLKEDLLNERNQSFREVETLEIQKVNEKSDWIVQAGTYLRTRERVKYYTFRKITYEDGTISGSTDFDIFTVNELKSALK